MNFAKVLSEEFSIREDYSNNIINLLEEAKTHYLTRCLQHLVFDNSREDIGGIVPAVGTKIPAVSHKV